MPSRRWVRRRDAIQGRGYLGEHPGKGAGGICTSRKPKNAYLVSILICSNVAGWV